MEFRAGARAGVGVKAAPIAVATTLSGDVRWGRGGWGVLICCLRHLTIDHTLFKTEHHFYSLGSGGQGDGGGSVGMGGQQLRQALVRGWEGEGACCIPVRALLFCLALTPFVFFCSLSVRVTRARVLKTQRC